MIFDATPDSADVNFFFSGNACRHQVNSYLQKYKTLEEAEEDLQINCFSGGIQECSSEEASSPVVSSTPQSLQDKNTSFSPVLAFSPHSTNSSGDAGVQVSLGESIATVVKLLAMMSSRMSQGVSFISTCLWNSIKICRQMLHLTS